MNYLKSSILFVSLSLLLLSDSASAFRSPPALPADSLSLQILDFPDSGYSCAPLSFRVAYNTNGRDMKVNITIGADPADQVPRNFGDWVNGTGELTYHYRVPNRSRASGFWCTAYLTADGTWSGRELVVTTANKISKILPADWSVSWSFDAPALAWSDSTFYTTVHYACADLRPRSIPNLVVDLVAPDKRIVARQMEWSVPESASYRHAWRLPANVDASALTLAARLEDETLDPSTQPIASGAGPTFPFAGSAPADFGRVAFRADTLLLDGSPAFLHGVDIFSFWYAWPDSVARRELGKMHAAGLNYARVFLDWSSYQNRAGQFNAGYKRKIATFLHAADSLNIWIEIVPVGNWGDWVYDMYRDHWWTNPVTRRANEAYFEEIGHFLDSLHATNIYYVSMMQEGSWYFDWYDPYTGREYPGAGALAEADSDWAGWMKERGMPYRTFDQADAELFNRWCAERFADLLALRAAAFRRGSRNRYAVGAEGLGSGSQYDRRQLGKHCAYYTLPELWAHTVDVLEVHNYTPAELGGYWSYATGFRSFRDWTRSFRKPVNAGEVNYTYCDNNIDMGGVSAWSKLKDKLDLIRSLGYTGYAVWAWMDYDQRKLGLLDGQYRPRPILDSLSRWIGVTPLHIAGEAVAEVLTLDQNFPNPFGPGSASRAPGTTLRFTLPGARNRMEHVRLRCYDLLGRERAILLDRELPGGAFEARFDAGALPAGAYLFRLETEFGVLSRIGLLVR